MKDELGGQRTDLKVRTRQFALRVIRLYSSLPSTEIARTIGKQLLRSGTSVGAQYREGVRARSDAELVSKWGGSLQELEETEYWLELLVEAELVAAERLGELRQECHELIAILTTCVKNVRGRSRA